MSKLYAVFLSLSLVLFSFAASAQVFPYVESLDSYAAPQPMNGLGGIKASSHVMVMARGLVGNCVEFQMTSAYTGRDTLSSPAVGPLTANSAASFYFRVVTYSGGVPSHYAMSGSDKAEIYVADTGFLFSSLQYTINSATQPAGTNYVKITVAGPSLVAGIPGKFRIVTYNTSGHNWLLEMDSLVVRDTLPIPPVLSSVVINDSCRGDSTGSIQVTASGATAPYHYHWSSTNVDTSFINHLSGGVYTVTVTDALGATATLTSTVSQPAFQLLPDSIAKTNELCHSGNTATITIVAKGGTPGYSYHWNTTPPQNTAQASNLPAGTYSVTVTDSRGCTVSATSQITEPAALNLAMSSTPSSGSNGTATVAATGGTGPLSYIWTPTAQTSTTISGLAPGLYLVQVTDSNNCTAFDSVRVTNLIGVSEVNEHALQIYPNPASDHFYISVRGVNQSAAAVVISDMSGRVVLADDAVSSQINVANLNDGVYIAKLTMGNATFIRRIVIQK